MLYIMLLCEDFSVSPCYDNKTVIDFLGKSYLIQLKNTIF